MTKLPLWTFIAGSLLLILPCAAKTVNVKSFQIAAEHHRYFSGYETGTNSFSEYDTYVVHYGRKSYAFDAPNGIFENEKVHYSKFTEAYVIPSTPPTIMVMVGDPNNTFFYYLIHEVKGTAAADFLSRGRQPPGLAWLNAKDGQPGDFSTKSPASLAAGTLLLLNSDCVLNTQTLEKHPLSAVPDVYFQYNTKPLMLSPDQHIFVRLGEKTNDTHDPVLVATDFITNHSTIANIDKKRMPCDDWSKLDYAWVDHHFVFSRDAGGNYVFAPRADFMPLAHPGEND